MSKNRLVAKMRDSGNACTTVWAENAIDRVFDAIRAVVEEGHDVRIPGFGTFKRKFRDSARRRNPRTGETVITAARHVITFKEAKPPKN